MERTALDFALEKTAGIFSRTEALYNGAGRAYNNIKSGLSTTFDDMGSSLSSGDARRISHAGDRMVTMGKNTAKIGTMAVLGAWGAKMLIKGLMNDYSRKALLEDLILNDPIISQADPEKVKGFYATIHHLAPSLSADKNIVRELLQNFVKFDRVDMSSIKALADTHKSLVSGKGDLTNLLK